jgi:uncharacterized protein YijF (DUF1287 family)
MNRWHFQKGTNSLALAGLLLLAGASGIAAQTGTSDASARQEFLKKLVAAAEERTHHTVRYDPAYVRIPYPGGDVPADTGVCTDEVIRSYRAVGVDLQKEVHEDMEKSFSVYPRQRRWQNWQPDTNIDHRRVPNLMVFFSRKGETLAITARAEDYLPGDIVAWDLGGGVLHIGIVVGETSAEGGRHLMVHNIGQGPKREDVLFQWRVIGHYRVFWLPLRCRRPENGSSTIDKASPGGLTSIVVAAQYVLCFVWFWGPLYGESPLLQRSRSRVQVRSSRNVRRRSSGGVRRSSCDCA